MFDALTGILRRGLRKSRALSGLAESMQFEFEHPPDGPVVLVHSMAGTGAETIIPALVGLFPRANIYHTHYLNPDTIRWYQRRSADLFTAGDPDAIHEYLAARALAARMRGPMRAPWKVIILVRDPVARTIDAFFSHFRLNHPDIEPGYETDPAHVDRLIDLFLDPGEDERGVALEWFEREVRDVFGVDVFELPFPAASGYTTWHSPKADLLLLRAEDLEGVGPNALATFLSVPAPALGGGAGDAPTMVNEAVASFIERLRPPDSWLNVMYGSRLARHFYTEAETAEFRARWTES